MLSLNLVRPVEQKRPTGVPCTYAANDSGEDPRGTEMKVMRATYADLFRAVTYAASNKLTVVENPRVAVRLDEMHPSVRVDLRKYDNTMNYVRWEEVHETEFTVERVADLDGEVIKHNLEIDTTSEVIPADVQRELNRRGYESQDMESYGRCLLLCPMNT